QGAPYSGNGSPQFNDLLDTVLHLMQPPGCISVPWSGANSNLSVAYLSSFGITAGILGPRSTAWIPGSRRFWRGIGRPSRAVSRFDTRAAVRRRVLPRDVPARTRVCWGSRHDPVTGA